METHFENIREIVLKELDSAEFFIYASVAWITDYPIIEKLIQKIESGIRIELIINDDDRFEKRKVQFDTFRKAGGNLYLYKNDVGLMHNKFCVIDFTTTLTGSYNWSHAAATVHKENIIIARDDTKFSKEFAREFKKIKKECVLYAGKQTNYDVSNYAYIDSTYYGIDYVEKDGKYYEVPIIIYNISQGNKFGIIQFQLSEPTQTPPKKIFGFWTEPIRKPPETYKDFECLFPNLSNEELKKKVKNEFPDFKESSGGLIVEGGRTWYNFECLDPNLLKYVIQ